ncbi:GntR family transcriptional regulator [Tersicoccus solisilvae]|uniref:GntR family transcriptional regulator n=1 Tax=Tersicoccus solisilvae TaxID=1882339 RepID=A0ABQ1NSE5_9MICC|nr:GntR family transcriptional regulator [Tersicoccus solisilvae]GGC83815.1 GntR family transcriptional regulator [Tersicoccus solisilvae]
MGRRASDMAYVRLRTEIVDWRIPPGTVLAEVELSGRLGVSRTPVREALSRLVADGLAAPQGGRGVTVTAVSLDDARDLFDVRVALDGRAAALAARRADPAVFAELGDRLRAAADVLRLDEDRSGNDTDAYYALVARLDEAVDDAVANPHLFEAQRRLRAQLTRLRRLARDNPRRLATSALEHAAIADAIAAGDADLAVAATRLHLANALAGITTAITADAPRPAAAGVAP